LTVAENRVGGAGDLSGAIKAAQNGDEDAFRQVYREVQPALLRYVRALVGDDSEDVVSEAWLQIARGFDSFHGGADEFRAWSATIARNRALDHLRHTRRRPQVQMPPELMAEIESSQDTATEALDAVGVERAVALIARLPRDQAEAVLLRVVMGLDAKSAGQVLGKRSGAVRTAAYRGLRRLAELLDHDTDGNGSRPAVPKPRGPHHGGAA
jgi:RNA polymerase sigma-70 factor (ECF subfamily)